MSSNGEKKIFLTGNQEGYPVRAGGDFVFVRAAASPIRVIIDGQPVVMEAGEKRRINRKEPGRPAFDSFEVDNLSDTAQSITFVVGTGDYDKLIVSGELNVSAYVSSSIGGESSSLSASVTKTMGLVNTTEQAVTKNQLKQSSANTTGVGWAVDCFYFDGEFYGLDQTNLYNIDIGAAPFKSVQALNWGAINPGVENIRACGVTPGGTVYFKHNKSLYYFNLNDFAVTMVPSQAGQLTASGVHFGGFIHEGVFYFLDSTGGTKVVAYDIATDTATSWTHAQLGAAGQVYSKNDGFLYHSNLGSEDESKFTLAGVLVEQTVGTGNAAQGGVAYSDDLVLVCVNDGTLQKWNIKWNETATYYGEVYIQNTGDITTRKSILLDEPFEWAARLSKTLMTGRVARVIMRILSQTEGADYLDSLVSFEWTDGYNLRKVSGGTQTWQLRGLLDEISILLDSEFTIEVLPGYLK